ncbi:MAG: hypothetical protein KF832_19080 [Caldilineaceae bacterium]|nr:hypothetical protein [Caldilineaceae bacterium]
MSVITLANDQLRLVVDPQQGVNVLAFFVQRAGEWLPVMPDVQGGQSDLKASSFVLVPYSNRIEQGRFTFQGQAYQLANGERHASHGDVRGRAWQVEKLTATALHCSFDSRTVADANWPWPFTTTLDYALQGNTLFSRLTVTNQGTSPMPAGLGWHPYYNRTVSRAGEPVLLHFQVESVYPDANDNRIPSGPAQPIAPNQDFATERVLTPANFIDACFSGYVGNGSITWPESKVKLVYTCSPNCTHLILYNPAKPYFAAEPVTNANNGVNLYAQGDPTSGIQVLEPGATLEATFAVDVQE